MYMNKIASLSELALALVLLVDPLQTVSAALLDDPSLREDVDEVLGLNLVEVVMTLAVVHPPALDENARSGIEC